MRLLFFVICMVVHMYVYVKHGYVHCIWSFLYAVFSSGTVCRDLTWLQHFYNLALHQKSNCCLFNCMSLTMIKDLLIIHDSKMFLKIVARGSWWGKIGTEIYMKNLFENEIWEWPEIRNSNFKLVIGMGFGRRKRLGFIYEY